MWFPRTSRVPLARDPGPPQLGAELCLYINNRKHIQNRYTLYGTVDWYNLEHSVTKYFIDTCAKKYNTVRYRTIM